LSVSLSTTPRGHATDSWIAHAQALPIAFAQVREDPLVDLHVLERLGSGNGGGEIRALVIGSGGCTVAALAASGLLAHLHVVDVNPAQIALCRLKLHLLQTCGPPRRMEILGHTPLSADQRAAALSQMLEVLDLPVDALGPSRTVAEIGPDHAGRYELLFARLREHMAEYAGQWAQILALPDADERVRLVAPDTRIGCAMDQALDEVMALPHLVRLFGAQATQNSREPFSRHFARRIRHAIDNMPTHNNPFLWQLLLGRFPPHARYSWLDAKAPKRLPDIIYTIATLDAVLAANPNCFDFVHLSNVLDWLAPHETRRTLELTYLALRPGGCALIRQLNSSLDIPSLGQGFNWLGGPAEALHAQDRSFFYRSLFWGRKR